ncbi:MAG: glycosyltransferase family 4 protein [Anaerolineae bacterium]|nr:glycosyltransferase family 4 protein [Anaerolineae bacterium]
MHILLLTQVLPYPPDSGPKIKTYHVLRYLAQRHSVHLVSFIRSEAEVAHIPVLRQYCQDVRTVPIRRSRLLDGLAFARSLVDGRPFLVVRDDDPWMHRTVAEVMDSASIDAIHADQLTMAQYALPLEGAYRVLDAHNAVWTIFQQMARRAPPGPRRWALELEWRKLKRYEGEIGRRFDAVTAVSEEDREALIEAGCPASRITVIPIAVDTEETQPVERVPGARGILHIGTMYWPPNIEGILWFAQRVYPLIRERVPDAPFFVVGARPPKEIRTLEAEIPGVQVTGYVEDPTPYIRESGVFIVPLHTGSGMRVKILTAWAWGIPVVSTSVGCAGIPVRPGTDILVADSEAEFAAAVLRVLEDREAAARLAAAGRRYVEEQFDWRVVCQKMDQVYAGVGK